VVILATGAGYYLCACKTRMCARTGTLICQPNLNVADPLTGAPTIDPTTLDREPASVGDVLVSPDMHRRARVVLKREGEVSPAGYTITATPQTTMHGITSTTSNVVVVTSDSPGWRLAAAIASAYTTAYVA
jgi:hypothetical protein